RVGHRHPQGRREPGGDGETHEECVLLDREEVSIASRAAERAASTFEAARRHDGGMYSRRELHHLVLDVEFVLISVVQGVALTTLAAAAAPMLRTHQLMTYVFVATGLLFVLSFWSVALVHAISFLSWPMDLVHYFFYFGVALVECLTFAQMARP